MTAPLADSPAPRAGGRACVDVPGGGGILAAASLGPGSLARGPREEA
jgi:hypothetical protein